MSCPGQVLTARSLVKSKKGPLVAVFHVELTLFAVCTCKECTARCELEATEQSRIVKGRGQKSSTGTGAWQIKES